MCPKCHTENSVSNTQCDICGTALGGLLVSADTKTKTKWVGLAVVLTWLIFVVAVLSPIHRGGVAFIAIFYGPLLTSYWADNNVVWESGLGGVIGIGVSILTLLVLAKDTLKAMLYAIGDAGAGEMLVLILITLLVLVPMLLPFSLMGATVGEAMSQRRRKKTLKPADGSDLGEVDPASVKL